MLGLLPATRIAATRQTTPPSDPVVLDVLFDYLIKIVEQIVTTGDASRPLPKVFSELK